MSAHVSRLLRCKCIPKLIFAAIFTCACTALSIRADERPARPAGTSVATAENSSAPRPGSATGAATTKHIEQLIHDLGNSHYPARRAAANELRQIGADAFDLLNAATDAADPEVAASANYLLRQIPVRWVQTDDPAPVRTAMRQFGQESEAARLLSVARLDALSGGEGTAALCRIARYDRSPLVSRAAALAIIQPEEKPSADNRVDPGIVEHELGASTRPPAMWLRHYLVQLRDPAASVAGWKQLIDQESARLDKNLGDTSGDVLLGLVWNLADVYRQLGDGPALNGALDRMIVLAADGSDDTLLNLMAWLTEYKSWDALDSFLAKHQSRLEQSKRPLYYAALAREKQGKRELAEDLAAKAAALPPQARAEGIIAARDLEERGKFEWAVREYRRAR